MDESSAFNCVLIVATMTPANPMRGAMSIGDSWFMS
jgi:hypothetical protein